MQVTMQIENVGGSLRLCNLLQRTSGSRGLLCLESGTDLT